MEYYTSERTKEFLPFATAWMDLESTMPTEISPVVRDKHHNNSSFPHGDITLNVEPKVSKANEILSYSEQLSVW